MRPVTLKLKSFTSFREEQAIDFTDLDLFALTGPMGAGKSSILDAMTYALFGHVDRVGHQTSQLVSQGQPRMAVEFVFRVDGTDHRVARSTTSGGQTRVLFERQHGDEWRSFEEGADRVREANRLIEELIGLDYDAFTRSVVLPQGRFAELLKGDARKRREILTDLLGLALFERMARRAREISTESKTEAQFLQDRLDTEYAGIDESAVTLARERAAAAVTLSDQARELDKRLHELVRAFEKQARVVEDLEECCKDIWGFSETLSGHAEDLADHEARSKMAAERLANAERKARDCKTALDESCKARVEAEERWGNREQLAALAEKVRRRDALVEESDGARRSLEAATTRAERAGRDADIAARALKDVDARRKEAASALERCENALEDAHRRDHVGALVAELEAGAPCPICERPLEDIPEIDRDLLRQAKAALGEARATMKAAEDAHNTAQQHDALARKEVLDAAGEIARCTEEAARRAERAEEAGAEVAAGFGGEVPLDPGCELDERRARLTGLVGRQESARSELEEADESRARERDRARSIEAEIAVVRAALGSLGIAAALARMRKAWPKAPERDVLAGELPESPGELAEVARAAAMALEELAGELENEIQRGLSVIARLQKEGFDAVPEDLDVTGDDLDKMAASASRVAGDMRVAAERAGDEVKELERRLVTRRDLERRIESSKAEQGVYSSLAQELRQDRIVDYLQAEALKMLAVTGTRHLSYLSSGRYRLAFEEDRFYVIDAWNGEERRRVDTLSGGETFLASLALSLALSEEVQNLSVTSRHRMESLFLDEGFGSLDAEALEVVTDALVQLGGDDRMVGVITHVSEVANAMPVRLVVEKSPRGSRVAQMTEAELPD